MTDTIVVGYDGSAAAKGALAEAIALAGLMPDGEVVIACGQDRKPGYLGYSDEPLWKEALELNKLWEQMESRIQQDLEEAVETVRDAGIPASSVCGQGRPANILKDVAHDVTARLIVVSTHGSGKDEETTVLGSTTTELLHITNVPVLVVPH
jgi:nucleotide-binding universal stress UspA family protein